jgi:hypothetical protein
MAVYIEQMQVWNCATIAHREIKIDVSDSGWVRKYHRSGAIAALRFSVSQSHFKTEKIRLQHERSLVVYVFLTQLDRPQSWPQFEYVRIKSAVV